MDAGTQQLRVPPGDIGVGGRVDEDSHAAVAERFCDSRLFAAARAMGARRAACSRSPDTVRRDLQSEARVRGIDQAQTPSPRGRRAIARGARAPPARRCRCRGGRACDPASIGPARDLADTGANIGRPRRRAARDRARRRDRRRGRRTASMPTDRRSRPGRDAGALRAPPRSSPRASSSPDARPGFRRRRAIRRA